VAGEILGLIPCVEEVLGILGDQCFRLTELAFDVEVKKLQDPGAQSGIDIGRRLGLKRIVRLREGRSGKQGEQSEAVHDYLNYRRVARHAQGGLAAYARRPASGRVRPAAPPAFCAAMWRGRPLPRPAPWPACQQ